MESNRPATDTTPLSQIVKSDSGGPGLPLPQLGILAGLSKRSLDNLAGFGRYDHFAVGSEIMREGKKQDRFYVVVSGELAVTASKGTKELPLSVAKAGECLGEVSLLEPGPASASVRVTEDAILWSMDINDLRAYLLQHTGGAGALLMGMATCLSSRLRQANLLIAQHHVIPVETLPQGHERAITADNAPVQIGIFDRIKKTLTPDTKKIRISTKIKM
jgi:CRP-like cAMP-binding protein